MSDSRGPRATGAPGRCGAVSSESCRVLGLYNKAQGTGPARDTVRIKTCLARDKGNRMKRRRPLVGVSGNAVGRKEKGSLVQIVSSENLQVKLENSHDQVANSNAPRAAKGLDPGSRLGETWGAGQLSHSAPALGSAGWQGLDLRGDISTRGQQRSH